ncbi:MAG TPA: serine hydrolase domain-containing protein [Propionibacteriaceae bacterium]|nr:serine hydrolase domain-containing protein [Propionibacteriaceae bacterium]
MAEAELWSGTVRAARGSEVVEELSLGVLGGPGTPPCSPTSRFQAGSISKLVQSVVALHLADRHRLRLDEPISRRLGDLPPAWSTITLHQLLTHTSGLGHWGDIPGLPPLLESPPPPDDLVALVISAPLAYPPGAGWRYSGPGFVLAALVLEAAAGRPYSDLADDLVIGAAGLSGTTSGRFPVGDADVATGHHRGSAIRVDPGFAGIPGTGDVWTTTADLVRLAQALRGGDLLAPASAAGLWTPHARLPGSRDTGSPLRMEAYGYGTFLGQLGGRTARMNPGDNPGFQSLLAYLPDDDLDLAILCNEDAPSVEAAVRDLGLA